MLIRELNINDKEEIKKIISSRNKMFLNYPFNSEIYVERFDDETYYTSDNKIILGYFDNNILDRFMIFYFIDDTCVISFQMSLKGIQREKNKEGWTLNYSDFFTKSIEWLESKGITYFWTLTPEGFRDNENNPSMPIYRNYRIDYKEIIPAGKRSSNDFIYNYVSEKAFYEINTIAKKYSKIN